MKIIAAEFVVGAVGRNDLPGDGLPEVAFSGRSNVGKSSLLNRLSRRRRLARTSSTPGKTQQLNYYRINDAFYLVDLPGYGYVSGGVELRRTLGRLTDTYLGNRPTLRAVVQLVDIRNGPTALDLSMIDWLRQDQRPFLLVFTKVDKLSRNQRNQRFRRLEAEGQLENISYVPFSAVSGEGREDILSWISAETGCQPISPQ
ncbi:MAG: YihA family ribosome biogenesis GTP-binding protein [Candidatus Latescibacteria bacterium]|nr:YihA family ribosome biogenesis GTP-binding protein [Candidatus Latescibacterota bacterium]